MNCDVCHQRYALAERVLDSTGLLRPMCIECAAKHARPTFAQGTQPMRTDFADHIGVDAAREVEIATARAAAAISGLRTLVQAWRKEMRSGYATVEQQNALRMAEALIAESEGR